MEGVRAATRVALPFGLSRAAEIRHRLRDETREAGLADALCADAETVLGELVGNALLHGRPCDDGNLHVEWRIGRGAVRLAVSDGGSPDRVRAYDAPSFAGTGRGLRIVAELSREWGVEMHTPGVTVWALV